MAVNTSDMVKFEDELSLLEKEIFEVQLPRSALAYGVEVRSLARRLVPVDTTGLKLSIESVVKRIASRKLMVQVGPTKRYGAAVEFGTGPHFVSPKALAKWARKRGLNEYAVANAIAKKGTRAQPYMGPAFLQTRGLQKEFVLRAVVLAIKKVFAK